MQVFYSALCFLGLLFQSTSTHFTELIQTVLITTWTLWGSKGLTCNLFWLNLRLRNLHPHRICNFLHTQLWVGLERGHSIQPIKKINTVSRIRALRRPRSKVVELIMLRMLFLIIKNELCGYM